MPDIDIGALLNDPRMAIGGSRISDAAPAGMDMREEPDFEEFETEFRKMETAGPAAVDWKTLNKKTLGVLETKSKDLVLASRLVYGLYREENYAGLAVGISIVEGMVSGHWEGLFPPVSRERGRVGTIDWISDRLASLVESQPPAAETRNHALVAHDKLVELDTVLGEKLQKHQAALGPLIRALRPYAREAREALEAEAQASVAASEPPSETVVAEQPVAPPPVPEPVRPAAPQPAAAVAMPAVAVEIPAGEGAEKSLQAIFLAAGKVAGAVRQEAPSDPRGFLCARFAAWGQVRIAPPDNGGKTALPPPQKTKLAEIRALQAAGNQQALLVSAESAFLSSPFWLDAQYLAVQAMRSLGPDYEAAQMAVSGQLAAFLRRIPGLTGLSFNDGTPFADSETLAWIGKEVAPGSGGEAGQSGVGGSELEGKKAAAGRLGQAGQVLAGLKILTDHADTAAGERERFLARLEVGEYCLRFELLQPLFALLENLRQTVERRSLAKWEPKLAVALASLSWRSFTHKNAKRVVDERETLENKARIMMVLAELDMVSAAKLTSSQAQ